MPEPRPDPNRRQTYRVALTALVVGVGITAAKLSVFWMTNSVAVLSDALESIINIAAAGVLVYTLWLSNRPADREHPYGHGKVQFLAVGLEGWLILLSAVLIFVEAVRRLIGEVAPQRLETGAIALGVIAVAVLGLGAYVLGAGKRYDNHALRADGRHLLTDAASTIAVVLGLLLVRTTGKAWIDPLVAMAVAGFIFWVSWCLLWESIHGLMDRIDPADDRLIRQILDEEVAAGTIMGYHKVRHRHTGAFHWVDMHLEVDGRMSVERGHEVASRIVGRIERALGQANATAHMEPRQAMCETGGPMDRHRRGARGQVSTQVATPDDADGTDADGEGGAGAAHEPRDRAGGEAGSGGFVRQLDRLADEAGGGGDAER